MLRGMSTQSVLPYSLVTPHEWQFHTTAVECRASYICEEIHWQSTGMSHAPQG